MSALSAALLIFSFQFSLFFFIISVVRPHQHCGVLLVLIRNIGHRTLPKIWVVNFLVRNVGPTTHREDFELILTVKIETRHPLESQFGSDFPVICNHCVAMMAWSRKTWKFCEQFCVLGKIFKILFRKFTWRHRLTLLCSNVVKFVLRKTGEIVCYLPDQKQNKISVAFQTVATARIAPKVC